MKKLWNWKSIGKKIVIGYAIIILLAIVSNTIGYILLRQNRNIDEKITTVIRPALDKLKVFKGMISNSKKLANNWVYQPSPEEKELLKDIHDAQWPAFYTSLDSIETVLESDGNEVAISEALALTTSLIESERKIMSLLSTLEDYGDDSKIDQAISVLKKDVEVQDATLTGNLTMLINEFTQEVNESTKEKYDSYSILQTSMISLVAALIVIGIIATFKSTTDITKPVNNLKSIIHSLSKGALPEKQTKYSDDEIGKMTIEINNLISNLGSVSNFAKSIGRREFETDFEPLSNEDVLGNALLLMRDDLKKAADEESKRNWGTQGFAKFGDLLRVNHEDLESLSFTIISELVKYMNANQGAIFVINDSEHEDPKMILKGCYAYNRKKFLNMEIGIGEGLAGQCWQEGVTIFMTDVPEKYVNITSGLGEALPRCILIVPLKSNEVTFGVIEIASFQQFKPYQVEFVEKLGESIASVLSTMKVNQETARLLKESKILTEQLRSQEEELKQNTEELQATQEEMERTIKELQTKLSQYETVEVNGKENGNEKFSVGTNMLQYMSTKKLSVIENQIPQNGSYKF